LDRHIFISYAIDDRDLAATICELLESSGRRCWLAPRDILPGSDWGESIIDAINQSQLMVLIYSDKASRSIQVKREIERASSKGLTIIPFRTEEIPVAKSLEYFLSNAYWVDALSDPIAPHLKFLKEMVERLMGPAAESAAESFRSRQLVPETTLRLQNGFKKRRLLPRSRIARIITLAIAIVVLSAVAYFGIQRWRAGGDFEAHYNQSIDYMGRGEFDKAIEESNLAIAAAPANALGYRTPPSR